MIVNELIQPKSILVAGASNELAKPGGRALSNLIKGGYNGKIIPLNPKEEEVQGLKCIRNVDEAENIDLAIIAIASKYVLDTIDILTQKGTKAFIILSAGFSEIGEEGRKLEEQIVEKVNAVGGSLIGPNCIGILTPHYKGVFAGPLPELTPSGVDFVTGSGATAVFILETAIPMGIQFASLFSVGNSAQIGVEEVLQYWDENFDPKTSSKVKMIYIEQIHNPQKFLKHTRSLISKGCRIAAVKAGTTDAGSRAVSSHTGSLAGSDTAVDALFRKAGIVRCYGRTELAYVAGVFMHNELKGKNIAVVTHAGGPGVMLTDALSKGKLAVPHIDGPDADELKEQLFHGSSVANPIDFLATGTAEQLGIILDYVENKFDNIDGSAVIFGTPGLFDVTHVYELLHEKMKECKKPIYPVLPSVIQAESAIERFKELGRINFIDEVMLGNAITKVFNTNKPFTEKNLPDIDTKSIRSTIDAAEDGYLLTHDVLALLDASGIKRVPEVVAKTEDDAGQFSSEIGFPVVMKVIGPVHKSDMGGVKLYINNEKEAKQTFNELMQLPDVEGILIQKMMHGGTEIFIGAKKEPGFGHTILCGLGGIFIEVLKDVSYGLAPISQEEALDMIRSIKSYDIIKGARGSEPINEEDFADAIVRISALVKAAPEIAEMDINPLIGNSKSVVSVDARIRIEKL